MIELRPDSLVRRDRYGVTPVMVAFEKGPPTPFMANLLKDLVIQCPDSIRLKGQALTTALLSACHKFQDRELVELLVRVDPLALCIAVSLDSESSTPNVRLPYEAAAEQGAMGPATVDWLEDRTARAAGAAVEYALAAGPAAAGPLGELRIRAAAAVAGALPSLDLGKASGFVAAQALRRSSGGMDVCRALFVHEETRRAVQHKDTRELVLGKGVLGLYRMSLLGDRSSPSRDDQVRLLACVSDNLDCLFLQLRECAAATLISAPATASAHARAGAALAQPALSPPPPPDADGPASLPPRKRLAVARAADAVC
jgi:hypothetical protein